MGWGSLHSNAIVLAWSTHWPWLLPPLLPFVNVTSELGALSKISDFRGMQKLQAWASQTHFTDRMGEVKEGLQTPCLTCRCSCPLPHLPFCVSSSTPGKRTKKGMATAKQRLGKILKIHRNGKLLL